MLNFAEQTGSGAVIVVWSFLLADSVPGLANPLHASPEIQPLPTNAAISTWPIPRPRRVQPKPQTPVPVQLPGGPNSFKLKTHAPKATGSGQSWQSVAALPTHQHQAMLCLLLSMGSMRECIAKASKACFGPTNGMSSTGTTQCRSAAHHQLRPSLTAANCGCLLAIGLQLLLTQHPTPIKAGMAKLDPAHKPQTLELPPPATAREAWTGHNLVPFAAIPHCTWPPVEATAVVARDWPATCRC